MARVKRGVTARRRHKRLLNQAEGRRGTRSTLVRPAREALIHALVYAYRDRRDRKRAPRPRVKRLRLGREVGDLRRRQNAGLVDDGRAVARRKGLRRRGRRDEQPHDGKQRAQPLRHSREGGNPASRPGRKRDPRFRGGDDQGYHFSLSSR